MSLPFVIPLSSESILRFLFGSTIFYSALLKLFFIALKRKQKNLAIMICISKNSLIFTRIGSRFTSATCFLIFPKSKEFSSFFITSSFTKYHLLSILILSCSFLCWVFLYFWIFFPFSHTFIEGSAYISTGREVGLFPILFLINYFPFRCKSKY